MLSFSHTEQLVKYYCEYHVCIVVIGGIFFKEVVWVVFDIIIFFSCLGFQAILWVISEKEKYQDQLNDATLLILAPQNHSQSQIIRDIFHLR